MALIFCITTPAFGFRELETDSQVQKQIAFRAVGVAAANYLKKLLTEHDEITVGTGWGRTIEQMTLQLAVSAHRTPNSFR